MPTFEDMNELTMSGTLPERSAAKILSSMIPPTTLTFTSGCFASYSATTFLNSVSSWPALQPTQIVTVSALWAAFAFGLLEAAPTEAATAPAATSASTTSPVATRFIRTLPSGTWLGTFTRSGSFTTMRGKSSAIPTYFG